jgi:homoserine O-acetyltransferase
MDRIVATSGTAKTYGHGIVRLEGQIAALTTDPLFKGGDYTNQPEKGIQAFALVWTGWLFSQEWWRQELWRTDPSLGGSFDQVVERFRTNFIPGAYANDLILQMRTWERHDVGGTPPFHGDVEAALRSIKAQVLYMPSNRPVLPLTDARYEAAFIGRCALVPIPSLWGHRRGRASAADGKFLNGEISSSRGKPRRVMASPACEVRRTVRCWCARAALVWFPFASRFIPHASRILERWMRARKLFSAPRRAPPLRT